jgi:hypothetical protein
MRRLVEVSWHMLVDGGAVTTACGLLTLAISLTGIIGLAVLCVRARREGSA